jgi:hypothetical protein
LIRFLLLLEALSRPLALGLVLEPQALGRPLASCSPNPRSTASTFKSRGVLTLRPELVVTY